MSAAAQWALESSLSGAGGCVKALLQPNEAEARYEVVDGVRQGVHTPGRHAGGVDEDGLLAAAAAANTPSKRAVNDLAATLD